VALSCFFVNGAREFWRHRVVVLPPRPVRPPSQPAVFARFQAQKAIVAARLSATPVTLEVAQVAGAGI
jgi:hypothetical protein